MLKNGNDKASKVADIVTLIDTLERISSHLITVTNNSDEIDEIRERFEKDRERRINEIVSVATNGASPQSQVYENTYKDICRILIPCRNCLIKKAL